jgi:hypothetical protein
LIREEHLKNMQKWETVISNFCIFAIITQTRLAAMAAKFNLDEFLSVSFMHHISWKARNEKKT